MFLDLSLDSVALNDGANNDPGSDVDKGGDDGVAVQGEEEEANECDKEDENKGLYEKMSGTVWSRLKKLEHNSSVLA